MITEFEFQLDNAESALEEIEECEFVLGFATSKYFAHDAEKIQNKLALYKIVFAQAMLRLKTITNLEGTTQ